MTTTIWGTVKEGKIIPQTPLPEGARVQIVLVDELPTLPPELQEEFAAWDRASANALELVERLAAEGEADAPA
jgi:hypothetical protein